MKLPHSVRSLFAAAVLFTPAPAHAGPPYVTDDPEPVEYQHWEFYLATMSDFTRDRVTGTAPHLEMNYGILPNVQLHTIVPLAYARPNGQLINYGPGDIELGVKLRFVQESEWTPMVGAFPMLELPMGDEPKGLGSGRLHGFIPLWLQKSVGRWTSYGGGGYWLNPGTGNRSFWYLGWLVQRRLSDLAVLGTEIYYTTADQVGGDANLRFNLGLVLDFTDHHHLLVSGGRSIVGEHTFQGYLAYQLTL
jgi:hypothetical protein